MNNIYFVTQIYHNKTNNTWNKGVVIKENVEEALQTYHAYLGAYAYGHNEDIDYVFCRISSATGVREPIEETWIKAAE